ncbi:MAG: thioesterase family protein [bacterium]|nr:thioesterase family protein [bacterium]
MARVNIELPAMFPFNTELTIRITDINYGQHLGNDALLGLLHEARVRFLGAHGLSEKDVGGCGLIMADAAIVFKSQGRYGQRLRVSIAVVDPGPVGCDLVYLVSDANTGIEVARAKTGMVFFDYNRNKVARMPERFRALCPGH